MFSPELSPHWTPDRGAASRAATPAEPKDEDLSPSQREALEALVDRVNAARTIV